MIRFRVPLIGLALAIGLVAAPAGLQAGPQVTQPLPVMTEVPAQDRGEARVLLAQLEPAERQVRFPRVSDETATGAGSSATISSDGKRSGPLAGPAMMPDPYESVLIVLAAAVAGIIGLWLGHIAGFVRLFRNDETWPRTRA